MRVLLTTVGYKPAWNIGGPVHTVVALAEGMARRGHEVWVAATDSNLTERLDVDTEAWHNLDGVRVRYFRMQDSWTKRIPLDYFRKSNADYRAPGFARWLRGDAPRFDVVHSHLAFAHANRVAAVWCRERGVPFVYQQHGVFDPVRMRHRALKKRLAFALWERRVCESAAALIALTEYEAKTYRALGLSGRVAVIPNGVAPPGNPPPPGALLEHVPDISDEDVVALFLGRLHPTKGVDVAVEAFLRLDEPRARLVVAGPDEFGLREGLERRVREAGARVSFLGSVAGELKGALLHRADLFVLPTVSEGFSIAVLEALAHGCPVLTTDGAHFPEIEQEGAGLLLPRTADAFAQAVAELAGNPERRKDMGASARRLVAERYTWERIVDRFEDLYKELA
ncbi:MAG: glycosyltransferase [Armatimonadota bacterium]